MSNKNSVVTPVSNLFAQPTVADGSLKQRLWTTNANTAILSNVLTIESNEAPILYHFTTDKGSYPISSDVLAARALYESFQGAGMALDDLLGVMSEGFLNPAQKTAHFAMKSGTGSTKKSDLSPVAAASRVLTSGEYLANCVKLSEPDLLTFYADSAHVSEKTSKADLLAIIKNLRDQLVTEAQLTQYESIQLVEEQERAKYQALTDIGFYDISRLSTGLINTKISMTDFANNAVTKLVTAGFKMSGALTMIDAQTFHVSILEGTPEI